MKLSPERLPVALERGPLAPVYLIAGDEPLQIMEAADAVRETARKAGAGERIVLDAAERDFDWGLLAAASGSLSLFSSRRLLELRLGTLRPGADGGRALAAWAESPPGEDVLLVTSARLDRAAQQSAWYRAVEGAGVVVHVWPVPADRLPQWIARRATERGLRLDPQAAAILAARVEGNLLAAAQEIEKLTLAARDAALDGEAVRGLVGDSARYDAFDLLDAALAGDAARAARVVRELERAGERPLGLLGSLNWALHALHEMAAVVAAGASAADAAARDRAWYGRRELTARALGRLDVRACRRLLRLAARVDRTAKGMTGGDAWEELTWLALALAGAPVDWAEKALLARG